jgi:hypothetical protein
MEQENNQQKGPQFSAKLKKASAEIQAILKKHDIAGVIELFEPGFFEYAMKLNPSWSVVDINEKGQLKINPPIEVVGNPNASKKRIADTVNMLANLRLYSGKLAMTLTQAEMATRGQFGVQVPKPPPGGPIIKMPPNLNGKPDKDTLK